MGCPTISKRNQGRHGTECDPHEGKAVYELYKKMVKEKTKGLM